VARSIITSPVASDRLQTTRGDIKHRKYFRYREEQVRDQRVEVAPGALGVSQVIKRREFSNAQVRHDQRPTRAPQGVSKPRAQGGCILGEQANGPRVEIYTAGRVSRCCTNRLPSGQGCRVTAAK
jgi:hypothetical protein